TRNTDEMGISAHMRTNRRTMAKMIALGAPKRGVLSADRVGKKETTNNTPQFSARGCYPGTPPTGLSGPLSNHGAAAPLQHLNQRALWRDQLANRIYRREESSWVSWTYTFGS